MGLLMLLAATTLLLGYCQTDEKVSLYGASYIHFPVQEAKGGTDISFRFRTHLSDATLLLAAGKTDYCLIKLEAGRLKVNINLGAGESEISSPRGLTLNDQSWHEINLTRREANMTLQIDVIHTTRMILPGRFFVLNILYGVYIGGRGDFNELFLGHTEYMRGCMADILYNGANVIESTKLRKVKSEATAVTWGCSSEFDATRKSEISFLQEGAFVSIPRAIPRAGSRWDLELRTTSESGLLFYNAGQASHADYLGIELSDSKIRVLMNKGNGATELIHSSIVADGKWHRVSIDFNPNVIGIIVDDKVERLNLPSGGNRYLDLAETLYIGGTELNKRARAIGKGIKSGDRSYKGCIRNMALDTSEIGLPDVKISDGIVVGCVWSYPCYNVQPCIESATCSQLGVDSFQCTCDQPHCVRSNYVSTINANVSLAVDLEIVAPRAIVVPEGKHALVTSDNIGMVLDIAKYGANEDGVIFTMVIPPEHGGLILDSAISPTVSSPELAFTLHDIYRTKVKYVHDGSESPGDSMILELKLTAGIGFTLPGYLQSRLRFPLHVNVTPVNDPPLLEIPTTKVLRLAQGTRKTLTKELVWTVDPDTPQESLVYTVLRADTDAGHVEKLNDSSHPLETFTQAELAQGLISYVHHGNAKSNAMLGLQVSDGSETSRPSFLRISAYPLQIRLGHNTGLIVVHRSMSYLTPANLSFATNSDDSSIEILYTIVAQPQYGVVQELNETINSWYSVERFTSKEIEAGVVRYLHTLGSPSHDHLKFQASIRELRTQQTFDFNISFIDMELKEVQRVPLEFTNTDRANITNNHLKYETNPLITVASKIEYKLLGVPKYGYFMLKNRILQKNEKFNQEDIDSGGIEYHLLKLAYSLVEDRITFEVSAPQCQSLYSSLAIKHSIGKNSKALDPVDTTEMLKVTEGLQVPLNIIKINPRDFKVNSLIYNLTEGPYNGWLTVQCYSNQTARSNVTSFTSEELSSQSVYYVHDDSETRNDSFMYVAVATAVDFMYVGGFNIEVILRNDNPPVRSEMSAFDVVINGDRLITRRDLTYTDRDTGTQPSDLIYQIQSVSNGGIYAAGDSTLQLEEFSQQDINDRKILFKHRGEELGKIEFYVSDRVSRTPGYLEIRASPPYVHFRDSNATIVQFNGSVTFAINDFDIVTNIDVNDKQVKYSVTSKPKHGIILQRNNKEVGHFQREDLTNKLISYKHLGGSMTKDEFRIRVTVKGVSAETRIMIKVYSRSYWEPLTVKNNRAILVEEATSVLISKRNLEISHPKITPTEITYLIREWPRYGYLEVQTQSDGHGEESKDDYEANLVRHFDQSVINEARVYYVQSVANQTEDSFAVDVTNGITWMRGIVVNFVIIPDKLYVEADNISVIEGKTIALQSNYFNVITTYYTGKLTDYRIIEKPMHGSIIDSTKNNQIKKFSQKHLEAGVIVYRHSGDESIEDNFKMVVIAGDKTSQPFDIWVNIQPINDQVPVLVNYTLLRVWQGGHALLTSQNLSAIDNDTKPSEVIYNITSVKNGFFSIHTSPTVDVYNFTQEQIDKSMIMFTHTNGTEAAFCFTLTDGVHTTHAYNISIDTVPISVSIVENNGLNIFPLTRKPITEKSLMTVCTDPGREIRYIVRQGPSLGKIIMETNEGTWHEVDRFTQKDLNETRVTYEHTKQFMDLFTNDSFIFDVESEFAGIINNQMFRIDVSVSSGGLGRYIVANPVRVEEGGSAQVLMNISEIIRYLRSKSGISNPEVFTRLTSQPSHGHVMLLPDLNITMFSQTQIEGGKVAYYHDHSNSLDDKIQFSLHLKQGHVMLCNVTIHVIISPVNDEPFKLVTKTPFITVVQNQTQTITRNDLLTTDPDTMPEELVYDVISGPTAGHLLMLSLEQNTSEVRQVNKFSQQDVDANRLVYEHSGSSQSATFYFRVSDGRFTPVYTIFNVHVLPIKLNVTTPSPVSLQQGFNMGFVTEENIKLDTNARQEHVLYSITSPPKYGVLYVRDVGAVTFKHTDLLSKTVVFLQTDMSSSNDSFVVTARLSDYEVKGIRVNIRVTPLMIIRPMVVFAGEKNQITKRFMDATPLAEATNGNPVYRITAKSRYCKLKKIIRSSGEKRSIREREISRFSHREIISGLIYLVCRRLPTTDPEGLPDYFEFNLTASTYQPANGIFEIRLKSDPEISNSTLGGPMDPVGHEGEMSIAPNMSHDYLMILGMLLGVFVLGVLVIITIRCRQRRYKNTQDNKTSETTPTVGVIPLPRPPDHLMPSTPHLKRFGNESMDIAASTPLPTHSTMTSTLPQCKVIPLNPLESVTSADADVSARYPYGVPDGDDWSSFDTADLPCPPPTTNRRANPLLRRNQYWV
ncbi:chondroitin sulfate proteoglycan 4 [Diachasmimorpha longicaudata]|uniref:chondroitin sulfate proteoglycan 4 n=1 Tax=Diachasmimorpha longicaudata TaxID=58733 RepID=UPI0030B87D5A